MRFKFIFINLFFIILCVFLLFACQESKKIEKTNEIKPKYAKLFTIFQEKGYKVLHIFPDKNNLKKRINFVIFPKGEKEPDDTMGRKQYISAPIESIVILSHTHLEPFEILNEKEKITGIIESNTLKEGFWRKRFVDKKIVEVGKNNVINSEIIYEIWLDVGVDIIMTGCDKLEFTEKQLVNISKAAVPFLPNLECLEEHPLGKVEWIKVFGILLNKEKEAQEYFEKMEKNYQKK